jgi:hypothetical protein
MFPPRAPFFARSLRSHRLLTANGGAAPAVWVAAADVKGGAGL